MRGMQGTAANLKEAEAINALGTLMTMTELSCASGKSFCLDGDKLEVMSKRKDYADVWPIASLEVQRIHPLLLNKNKEPTIIDCPGVDCNHYNVFNNSQNSTQKVSAYVSLCFQRMKELQKYDQCEIAKVLVGVKN